MAQHTVGSVSLLPRWGLAAAALAAALAAGVTMLLLHAQTGQETRPAHLATPADVDPLLYELTFRVDVAHGVYAGDETVHLRVHRAVDTVSFHAVGLDIPLESIRVTVRDRTINATAVRRDDTDPDMLVVSVAEPLPAGEGDVTMQLSFSAPISDGLAGFYKATLKGDNTLSEDARKMAVTQFEPADARRAFPCWDEPVKKARFRLTFVVEEQYTVLSNTAVVAAAPCDAPREFSSGNGQVRAWKRVEFGETPLMSTYLVAFVVGHFDHVEATTRHGVTVRVYTPPGKSEQGRFALECGTWALDFYTDYFGVGFPLPKCDMVAVPDFSAGAMENWGLVTYREVDLLVDEARSSIAGKQRVSVVVSHELAHQWFGNLVTMKWWNDLWLNEGFATYIGTLASAEHFPQWDVWTDFISAELFRAMRLDALESTHPIDVDVATPAQIGQIFDAISYAKGASVIRMVAAVVGETAFREGLRLYIRRHQYGNTETADLWAALSETSGRDIAQIMDTWTRTAGFPVVRMSVDGDGGSGSTVVMEQERMLASGAHDADGRTWWIPMFLCSSDSTLDGRLLMLDGKRTVCSDVRVPDTNATESSSSSSSSSSWWVKGNAGERALVRVLYDEALLARLEAPIRAQTALTPADRIGVEADIFALARSGHTTTSSALRLAQMYRDERNPAVLTDVAGHLGEVQALFRDAGRTDIVAKLDALVAALFRPAAARLGWDRAPGEDDLTTQLRSVVLAKLAHAGDAATRAEALRRFRASLEDPAVLPTDQRALVYAVAARYGTPADVDALFRVYRTAALQEQRVAVLRALGAVDDAARARAVLAWAADSGEVRTQDVYIVLASAGAAHQELVWAFVQERWDWVHGTFGAEPFMFRALVTAALSRFVDETKIAEAERFFAAHPAPAAQRALQQSLETIRTRSAWYRRAHEDVLEWLSKNGF